MILMQGYTGQAPIVSDYATNAQIATTNFRAHAIVVTNGGATKFYVQVWDCASNTLTNALNKNGGGTPIPRFEAAVNPDGVFSLTHSQFYLGCYIQCVTAPKQNNAATLISSADAKITVEGTIWPVSNT